MNILVTGAGSLIGHGVLRSLREVKQKDLKIITADPDYRAVGHWLGDAGVIIPPAKDETYIQELERIVDQYRVDVVFIGTDPELLKISKAKKKLKAVVVVSDPTAIQIGDDKWDTIQFLKLNGLPYPDSALFDDASDVEHLIARVGFPLIAKPRVGARSAGVLKVLSREDLKLIKAQTNYIIQEFLPEEQGEFTAGTMTYDHQCYSCVIFRRDLRDGNTFRAYLHQDKEHELFLKKVSVALPGVYGPMNFQYRIKNGMPVIFEINSRFSGTTPLRTAVGVNEIEMAIDYIKNGALNVRITPEKKVAIFRTWSDIIVPQDQLDEFMKFNYLETPSSSYFPFKK